MEVLKKLLFWGTLKINAGSEDLLLHRGDSLTINKYVSSLTSTKSISMLDRIAFKTHGVRLILT